MPGLTTVGAGTAPEAAIATLGAARGPRALETIAHEDFVVMFASAISGALGYPRLGGLGPDRLVPASHRLDVSCQVQGHPPKRR